MPTDLPAEISRSYEGQELGGWLEYLTGTHSGKSGYYAAWRRSTGTLQRMIVALHELSGALSTTTQGIAEFSQAVVTAVAAQFDARCVALLLPPLISRAPTWTGTVGRVDDVLVSDVDRLPSLAHRLAQECSELQRPVVAKATTGLEWSILALRGPARAQGLAVPVLGAAPERARVLGSLLVLFAQPVLVDQADAAMLEILANQTSAIVENVFLYEMSEQRRLDALAGWEQARKRTRELEQQNRELTAAHSRLLQASQRELLEQERSRIATELHDSVAQYLVSIGMNIEWCRRWTANNDGLGERLEATQALTRVALSRVRSTISQLSCVGSDGGLTPALGNLAERLRGQIDITVRTRGAARWINPGVEHAVFHFTQEAIFNTVRHAGATRAWVTMRWSRSGLRVGVADNGNGHAPTLAALAQHATPPVPTTDRNAPSGRASGGIVNMRGWAENIGGQLNVRPRHGGGVEFTLHVPNGALVPPSGTSQLPVGFP